MVRNQDLNAELNEEAFLTHFLDLSLGYYLRFPEISMKKLQRITIDSPMLLTADFVMRSLGLDS